MSGLDWEAWLASPECLGALERAARMILRQAERIGLPGGLLPCDGLGSLSGAEREDCVRATAHDLWIFLSTRPGSWRERTDIPWLAEQGESFLVQRIGRDYFQHLKDQARTYGAHPMRALYRRVRQVLQGEPTVHYGATARGASYSLEPGAPELPDPHRLRSLPYEEWDSPLDAVPAAELHRKESLVRLARMFWRQAEIHLEGGPYALPIRELVYYLGRHYAHLALPFRAEQGGTAAGSGEGEIERMAEPGAERGPELAVVRSRLPELARKLVASWPEKLRTAFALIQGEGLTLEEAARRMGYKGASGVSYVYRSALERLRDFCLLWPGLSPPDLDEDLFDEFVSLVLAFCKKDG
jgi:hypothetical protein